MLVARTIDRNFLYIYNLWPSLKLEVKRLLCHFPKKNKGHFHKFFFFMFQNVLFLKTIIRSSLNPFSIFFSLQTTLYPPWWTPFFFFFPCIPSTGSVWDPKFVYRLAFWVDAESLYYKNKTIKEYISINEIRTYDINK